MKFTPAHTRIDQLLERSIAHSNDRLRIIGFDSPLPLALLLSQSLSKDIRGLPHLVVVSSYEQALLLQQSLAFFSPDISANILTQFDVSPYSGLYPKLNIPGERLSFLYKVNQSRPGDIFIAPIVSLLQKTLNQEDLLLRCFAYKKEDALPDKIADFLISLGFHAAPMVEDVGQFALRGGILDIFSPAHNFPVRVELFGEFIESLRTFSVTTQLTQEELRDFHVVPCKEALIEDDRIEGLIQTLRKEAAGRSISQEELDELVRSLMRSQGTEFQDFLLPYIFPNITTPLDHFKDGFRFWALDPVSVQQEADRFFEEIKNDFAGASSLLVRPSPESLYTKYDDIKSRVLSGIEISALDLTEVGENNVSSNLSYPSHRLNELVKSLSGEPSGSPVYLKILQDKLGAWISDGYRILVGVRSQSQAERAKALFDRAGLASRLLGTEIKNWEAVLTGESDEQIFIINRPLPHSLRVPEEKLIFLKDDDLLGRRSRERVSSVDDFSDAAKKLSFGDLKPGDTVVHRQHGVGIYEGLKTMAISGAESEFIQIAYKDKDKLYLPVYRVGQLQKYSGAAAGVPLDKLGGPGWEKTKTKVKSHLKDVAAELLDLYAKRKEATRPPFSPHDQDFSSFANAFPYEETEDQLRAIRDFVRDMTSAQPMDRLICGDVGFGKTEVAMRAAFLAAANRKQVAVLAPTTVLTFQHFETFKKRFAGWPLEIRAINRFVSAADIKKTINDTKEGRVDILIGTHRLLSKDIAFKDLGLLIIDEEQKFGVVHKERIRKIKFNVDTLALSATPIPRTLNMSLVGIRDLSLINSAPVDRLPTRTFICKFEAETIRKAIKSELARGGQVYFIHNRIQSIYGLVDELRQIVPEARIRVGHGQMEEHELEENMLAFFRGEVDVLVCTAIVESGMDIPNANTMFIDQAHMLGLSQLYQLRGRVGRSKQRAYCYLILPRQKQLDKDAQERLKVIQENTALGSGIRIAQYDLELRGAGNILGEEQSGHVNLVGYELYMDLLQEALAEAQGKPHDDRELDPEINLRVPALIPDSYISDIRVRLTYYKALSEIKSAEDLEKIEFELKDQFGEIPDAALNLMGLMLIRSKCKELGIKDVSAGLKVVSLVFSQSTKISPENVIRLVARENKKYSITPDNRLNIRINNITWPMVLEELEYLGRL